MYENEEGVTGACTDCPVGRYMNGALTEQDELADCTVCTPGMFTASVRTIGSCEYCEKGKQFADTTTVCDSCLTGKYQHLDQSAPSVLCKFCSKGKQFVSISADCSACDAGEYQDQDTATSSGASFQAQTCKSCGAGFSAATTQVACAACASGKFQVCCSMVVFGRASGADCY